MIIDAHAHSFKWQMAPNEDGETVALCEYDTCTAVLHEDGTINENKQ